jgi:L-cysteine desulfidase
LIVFAVTIIIAVGVLGTLAYFYNQSRQNATELSVLTSTTSSVSDLTGLGFCEGTSLSAAYVSYTPVTDQYTLTCSGGTASSTVCDVRGIIDCTCDGSKESCTYKVNR